MAKAPKGKPNSEIGPALAIGIIVMFLVGMICGYFGINPFG